MKKLVKIVVCAILVGSALWTATPSKQQNADFMGPGPMSVGSSVVADVTGPGPMSVGSPVVADYTGPGPMTVGVVNSLVALS